MPVMNFLPENSVNVTLYYKRDLKRVYLKIRPTYFYNNYHQKLQQSWRNIHSYSQNYNFGVGTYFKKYPNIDAGIILNYQTQIIDDTTRKSNKVTPFVELEYDFLKAFILKADYKYVTNTDYTNNINHYQNASLSLFYKKDNNPWGIELSANNLFNTKYKEQNYINDYLLTQKFTYLQPRLLMIKVSYKL